MRSGDCVPISRSASYDSNEATAVGVARPVGLGARPIGVGTAGPLIRKSDDEHRDRQFHDRVSRYATEWDKAGRPSRLLLRGRNLSHALEVLENGNDPDLRFGELEESFIRASSVGRERNKVVRRIGIAAGSVVLLGVIAVLATYGQALMMARISNRIANEVDGTPVYPSLAELPVVPDLVDVFRRREHLPAVLEETIAVGAKVLWLQLGLRDEQVARDSAAAGLQVVMDRCLKVDHARLLG